jgi:hypothetical protein
MPASSATNTVANQANTSAQQRGYDMGYKRARQGWAMWHSLLPQPLQVALAAHAISPDSITCTQHEDGSLTITVLAATTE